MKGSFSEWKYYKFVYNTVLYMCNATMYVIYVCMVLTLFL